MSIDIDAIEARANAATPGVWIQYKKYQTERYVCGAGDKSVAYIIPNDDERSTADDDLFFIVAARQDVPALCAEVRELRAALERARALLAEQAEIITANVWHIPPEYSARNIVMDAAAKMRELAAALAAASGGAA